MNGSVGSDIEQSYLSLLDQASHKIETLLSENRRLAEREPIAVVGVGCRFAGGVDSPAALWALLESQRDVVGRAPHDRCELGRFHASERSALGKTYVQEGAFLERVDGFDAAFFGIAPLEAEALDPQQRLLLEVCWEAFEHAGLDPERLRGSRTGVYLGMNNVDYFQAHIHSGQLERVTAHAATGVMFSTAAGRLAYTFDLRGPVLTLDTACSASLLSVHLAVRALRHGEADLAVAGGVNLMLSAAGFVAMAKTEGLSPDGRCRPFDAGANGYGRGEGCGLVVLKRLSEALEAGDRVLAVLEGSATNHDGRSNGLTAPNGPAQAAVIRAAHADARVSAASIGYVEAHGSATVLGDPIEAQALGQVFAASERPGQPLLIGSVKGHLGHTEAAAGVLGLIKAVLAVQRGKIPPTLHLSRPNPHIPVSELGLELVAREQSWPAALSEPRRAGVSSFGLSGSNVHVVVASAPERAASKPESAEPAHLQNERAQLLVLSAKTPTALQAQLGSWARWLGQTSAEFEAICHTAAVGRAHFEHRIALLADGAAAAAAQLEDVARGNVPATVFQSSARPNAPPRVLFVCSELEGSRERRWPVHDARLERALRGELHPVYRDALARCAAAARPWLGASLSSWLEGADVHASTGPTALARSGQLALQYAAACLWAACGLRPAALLGQGSGRWLAACLAGGLSLEEAFAGALADTAGHASVAPPHLGAERALQLPLYCTESGRRWLALAPDHFERRGLGGETEPDAGSIEAVRVALDEGHRTVVDLGEAVVVGQLAEQQASPGAVLALTSHRGDMEPRRAFLLAMARLYAAGYDFDWPAWSAHRGLDKLELPTYPFERKSFWMPLVAQAASAETPGGAPAQSNGGPLVASGQARAEARPAEAQTRAEVRPAVALARLQLESLERVLTGNLDAARQLIDRQLHWLGARAGAALPSIVPEPVGMPAPSSARRSSSDSAAHLAPPPRPALPPLSPDPPSAETARDTLPSFSAETARDALPLPSAETARDTLPSPSAERHTTLPPFSVAFEAQARRQGTRIAIEAGEHEVGYAELNRRANRLAHALVARGAGPGVVVAVALPQGIDYATALLGVAKARAVLLPVDASWPPRRARVIFEQAEPGLLVADERSLALLEALPSAERVLPGERLLLSLGVVSAGSASRPLQALSGLPEGDLALAPEPEQSAYMMFTSGSTGQPKALLGTHAGLSHFMSWELTELGAAAAARVSALAPITFDASLRDLLLPLLGGGTLCVPPADTRADPRALLGWLHESRVVTLHTVPSLLRLLLDAAEGERGSRLPALRYALLAGEPLWVRDARRFSAVFGSECALINLYGASETTMVKLFHRVEPEDLAAPSSESAAMLPIGVPMPGVEVFLVKDQRLAGPGEIGEICVQTPYRCAGYHRDPERTAQAFVPHPFSADPAAVLYKSGDLGRRRASGVYEFVGRLDRQVKIGGVRVELAEIDQALLASPEVREAHARAVMDREGQPSLVAYYSLRAPLEEQRLRERLREYLPSALLPTQLIQLERLPLNLHGKVDPGALPAPELSRAESGLERAVPTTETERVLLGIWQDVLGELGFGVESAFLDVGGNSLRALRVLARIARDLGASIRIRDFFADATIRRLGQRIDEQPRAQGARLVRAPEQPDYPLSDAQRRLWLHDRLRQDSSEYNLSSVFRIEGPLDRAALLGALGQLLERHEALRTTFPVVNGEPRQRIARAEPFPSELVDLAGHPQALAQALERARELLTARYDLGRGPLFRAVLYRVSERQHVLGVGLHHIISDGTSQGVLARDLGELYAALARGVPSRLPPLAVHYRDHACHQQARRAVGEDAGDREYWRAQLEGASRLDLPGDRPAPLVPSQRGASLSFELPPELRRGLERLSSQQSSSLFTLLLSLVKVLLHRYTGQTDVLVGSPWAGREVPELEDQVGFYVNLLPLRDRLEPEDAFVDVLHRVRDTVTSALEHAAYPFDRIALERSTGGRERSAPLVEVLVTLQDFERRPFELPGLAVTELELEQGTSRFPLAWEFTAAPGGGLSLCIEYETERFDRDSIQRAAAHFETLARAAIEHPERAIGELELLPAAERSRLIFDFNAPVRTLRAGVTLLDLFDEQVLARPEAPAVVDATRCLSYAELARDSERLARCLQQTGRVRPGEVVGVLLPRGGDVLVAFLAVLRCGGVYLPLDPSYPAERVGFLLEDSGCQRVITQPSSFAAGSSFAARVSGRLVPLVAEHSLLLLGADSSADAALDRDGLPERPSPGAPAYLIYTSGSTGTPKGVACLHGALANLALAQSAAFEVKPGDRVLQLAALGFDASLAEFAQALGAGAALVIAPGAASLRPRELLALLRREAITLATFPPSLLAELEPEPLPDLRTLVVAGEACPAELMQRWAGRVRFYNAYGPTEATVCASLGRCEPGDGVPSIGRAIDNVQVYVLDARLQPTPVGIAGELCIGGVGVAPGYFHRPEASAQKFVPDPFSATPNAMMYRTGDRARYRADGRLEFLGRSDRQLKLRGFRVEPAEVEQALGAVPGVLACAVTARHEAPAAQPHWVAYVVLGSASPSDAELRQALRERLPAHLIPSHLVRLAALPRTAHGKIDYAALPAPEAPVSSAALAPRDELERSLLSHYRELLGAPHAGIDGDFFELGGHSLLALALFDRLEREQGIALPLSALVQAGSVEKLAALLRTAEAQPAEQRPLWVALADGESPRSTRAGRPREADQPLVCIHPGGGDVLCFSGLARELGRHRPVYGVRAAGLEPGEPPLRDVPGMARRYLRELEGARLRGPWHLLGYSFGGLVAHEMARQLREAGSAPGLLVLLDTPCPGAELPSTRSRGASDAALEVLLSAVRGRLTVNADELRPLDDAQRIALLSERAARAARDGQDISPERLARSLRVQLSCWYAMLDYLPESLGVNSSTRQAVGAHGVTTPQAPPRVLLLRARQLDSELARKSPGADLGWQRVLGEPVEVGWISGDHESVLEPPGVQEIAACIEEKIAERAAGADLNALTQRTA